MSLYFSILKLMINGCITNVSCKKKMYAILIEGPLLTKTVKMLVVRGVRTPSTSVFENPTKIIKNDKILKKSEQ